MYMHMQMKIQIFMHMEANYNHVNSGVCCQTDSACVRVDSHKPDFATMFLQNYGASSLRCFKPGFDLVIASVFCRLVRFVVRCYKVRIGTLKM